MNPTIINVTECHTGGELASRACIEVTDSWRDYVSTSAWAGNRGMSAAKRFLDYVLVRFFCRLLLFQGSYGMIGFARSILDFVFFF